MLAQHPPRRAHLSLVPDPALPPPFGCTVLAEAGVVTVAPTGELDLATSPLLDAAMSYQRDLGIDTLVVDLSGVSFIDSSGVHLLLRWAQDAARGSLDLRVLPGPERVQKVFELTGVLEALGFEG